MGGECLCVCVSLYKYSKSIELGLPCLIAMLTYHLRHLCSSVVAATRTKETAIGTVQCVGSLQKD